MLCSQKYNTHTYQYDANGNLTYIATGRKIKDGHTEDLISEHKLLWDDENRLVAISDNGYVSTYRYDDAGNRTVKLSGHGEAVFVNGSESGSIFTQTNRFTAYPNPYMAYNGSRYYKHIYVGSERIVSKVSVNNPDYDPRQVDCAGNEITGYNVKLQSQQQALSDSIASIYAKFEVPYYPNNNDDYGYNWNDGLRRSVANPDSYGELAYFYHSDHLGSTSFVTDANGEVSQHVEYVPFGEVFIEELSSSAKLNTPFLFNGKELDEETGLYYYGARYYDPRISLWLSTDPMELKYPNISTYTYCANNPIKLIDFDGLEIEQSSQKEWDKQKNKITKTRDKLNSQIQKIKTKAKNNNWSEEKLFKKLGDKERRLGGINQSLANISLLETSSQVYSLNKTTENIGGLSLDLATNIISFCSTENFIHEIVHGVQFEKNELAFSKTNGAQFCQDVFDEIEAYKAQYYYNPGSIKYLNEDQTIKSIDDINSSWLYGIRFNNINIYAPGSFLNIGVAPVNINTRKEGLIKVYPNNNNSVMPNDFSIKTLPNVYYKK